MKHVPSRCPRLVAWALAAAAAAASAQTQSPPVPGVAAK
jgi:hypothetical protein